MSTITLKTQSSRQFGQGCPQYGNAAVLLYGLSTNATGGANDATSSAALAVGDVVELGILPAGLRLDDAKIIVNTGLTTGVTGSLGFLYEDGVDDAKAPQDAEYFGTGIVLSAAARLSAAGTSKLKTLQKPAKLVLTITGADNAKAGELTVLVSGEFVGVL